MGFSHLRVERRQDVATVVLARPEVGNAMSDRTLRELADCFAGLAQDDALRAVVVRGEGKHFCAGADIEWMRRAGKLPAAQSRKDAELLAKALAAVDACPVPVLVRAHGAVYGGGLGLVAAADVAVAAEDARMCFSECRLGILPAVISCWVLPKMGEGAARRYYLTSEVFGMEEARRLGLVHEVAPESELDMRVEALLAHVLRNGPRAVRAAKSLLRAFPSLAPKARLKLALDSLTRLRRSPEGQEGLAAFLEKRPASWLKGGS